MIELGKGWKLLKSKNCIFPFYNLFICTFMEELKEFHVALYEIPIFRYVEGQQSLGNSKVFLHTYIYLFQRCNKCFWLSEERYLLLLEYLLVLIYSAKYFWKFTSKGEILYYFLIEWDGLLLRSLVLRNLLFSCISLLSLYLS